MTENTDHYGAELGAQTFGDELEPDAPSFDPLAALTMAELDMGSRQLRASLVASITGRTADYERALAVTAWLHARRADTTAKLAPYMRMTFTELSDALAAFAPEVDGEAAGPTPPGPA
jgi:hypothetical protein